MRWAALAASGALAAAGGILYLTLEADWAWWVGVAMVMPLVFLVMREARGHFAGSESDGGAWGPP